jgi:hypothetical protein
LGRAPSAAAQDLISGTLPSEKPANTSGYANDPFRSEESFFTGSSYFAGQKYLSVAARCTGIRASPKACRSDAALTNPESLSFAEITMDRSSSAAPRRPRCLAVEVHNGDVWVKTTFTQADPAAHWQQRLADGLAHDLGLVVAKAVHGQLAGGVPHAEIVRQVALFGAQNRDGWGVGLTILTALANVLPVLPEEEALSRSIPWRAPRGDGLRW